MSDFYELVGISIDETRNRYTLVTLPPLRKQATRYTPLAPRSRRGLMP